MQQSGEGINQIKPLDEDIQFKFICLIDGFHRVYFQLLKPKWPLVDISQILLRIIFKTLDTF